MKHLIEWNNSTKREKSFLETNDWLALIMLALTGLGLNQISYNNMLSVLIQVFLLGLVFLLYRKRPAMIMVAYIFLTILPLRLYAGFSESGQGVYTLNPKICIAFAVFFMIYELVMVKRKYRIDLFILLFVAVMICSLAWTISMNSYTYHFWWMCIAYVFFPLLIREDHDIRIVVVSYIVAVDVFCLRILPILLTETGLYRGSINLNPNYAAFFVIISMALIFTMLTHYRTVISQKMKLLFFASAVLDVITMSSFASRTSFVMLAILIFIYLLFNHKQIKTVLLTVIGVLTLSIILNHYGVFDPVLLRFADDSASTGGGRIPIQMELLKSVYSGDVGRLIFGNGYLTAANFGLSRQAHNSYISILLGFGLVGLLIYLAYLFRLFILLRNSEYSSFLIMFYFLILYSFSLEPYHIVEGITIFCLLSGINTISMPMELLQEQSDHGVEV